VVVVVVVLSWRYSSRLEVALALALENPSASSFMRSASA
jgi:hypothetical protein